MVVGAVGRMRQGTDGQGWQDDAEAPPGDALWAELYPELKQLARSRLRRSGPRTLLDTTGLVNESYIRVVGAGVQGGASAGQFMAYAARTMRSVVVDLIRERQAQRRGGDLQRVTLNTAVMDAAVAADEPLRIDEGAGGAGAAAVPGGGNALFRRPDGNRNRRGAGRDGAHGAARLDQGLPAAAQHAPRRLAEGGAPCPVLPPNHVFSSA